MSQTYEQAVAVVKNLLSAVSAIEEERAKLAIVRQEAVKAVNATNEANLKLGDVNKSLRDVEAQLVTKRAELAKVSAEHDEVYAAKVEAQGKLNVIRTQMAELRQNLNA